jgi:putative ABC transport system substrate-binding protein
VKRRAFITLLGGAAAAWPFAARAQQASMPVIGYLDSFAPETAPHLAAAFREALKDSGYVEGQNVVIEYHWAHGQYDRLPALAVALVERGVTLLVAMGGTVSGLAAKAATSTLPCSLISAVTRSRLDSSLI